jgi:hypothetical protein
MAAWPNPSTLGQMVDFENIPGFPTPVSNFSPSLFPYGRISGSNWIASYVNATDFLNISNRCLGTYGVSPLTITFDAPWQGVAMDFGSGYRYQAQTMSVTGYVGSNVIFSKDFVTRETPSGAHEGRAQTFGKVDRIVLFSASGGFSLIVDNLSFGPLGGDADGDGVLDENDECPDTPANTIVDAHGCNIAQLVPCEGPKSGGTWKNHGAYLRAVIRVVRDFYKAGLLTKRQRHGAVGDAAKSDCGQRR